MNNNANDSKKSSLLMGIVAFAVILGIVVVFFTVSANQNGGSPAKPSKSTAATEVVANANNA